MKIFCLALVTLFAYTGSAQVQFENRYTGMGGSDAKAIRQTLDSGYIVVGGQIQPTVMMTVMKTDELGDTVWTRDFDSPASFGFNVEQCFDKGYIITGYAFDPSSSTIVIKLDSNGQTEWSETYSSATSEWGQAIKQLPDSGYIIAGARNFRIDKNGNVEWSQATAAGSQAMSLITTSDNNLMYTSTGSNVSAGTWVTKMDYDGNTIWSRSISFAYTYNNCDNNIAETSDGGYVLAARPTDEIMGLLAKFDSNGDTLWTRRFQPGSQGAATSVVESDSGGYLVGGFKVDGTGVNAYLLRTDEDGTTLWEKDYERAQIQSLIQTYDGGYAMAGYKENSSGKQKYFVAKLGGGSAPGLSIRAIDIPKVIVYPTVTRNKLNVNCTECYGSTANIFDTSGRHVQEIQLAPTIHVNLDNGAYFLVSELLNGGVYFTVSH
ncbi:MAG: Ig-like domain-containing protein [Salibacteraceae bacterium]